MGRFGRSSCTVNPASLSETASVRFVAYRANASGGIWGMEKPFSTAVCALQGASRTAGRKKRSLPGPSRKPGSVGFSVILPRPIRIVPR
jgi:hypothetical protein